MLAGLLCLSGLFALAAPLAGQLRHEETDIPVRDGNTLAADVYVNTGSGRKPVILIQTPYNKAPYRIGFLLSRLPGVPLDSSRYHYVVVDWRGFHASQGAAVAGYDRGLDGYDIVEWIAAQPWCNGKVATWGGSALGLIQFQTARHHPPHLVCAAPLIKDFKTKYSDYYYGGVLRREHVESLEGLGFISVDLVTSQPVENAYWRLIESRSDYASEIAVPMLLASGWFDHYPDDVIRAFDDLRARSDAAVRAQHRLIMGPWGHSEIDRAAQGELVFPDAENVVRDAALRFFDYHLHGAKNGWPLTPPVRYYQMGENVWRDCERWSDMGRSTRELFLAGGGVLTTTDTLVSPGDVFTADPRDPSPSHGGARFNPFDPTVLSGPLDISRVVDRGRGDAFSFTTSVLAEDLAVTGSTRLWLFVRSNRPDADFSVRLCDVYPDGRSIILTDGIQRARFREGTDREVFMHRDSVYRIDVALQEIAHTFLAGHRVQIVISGSNSPRYDVNLNNGGAMYEAGDTLVALNQILMFDRWRSSFLLESPDAGTGTTRLPTAEALRLHAPWPQPFTTGGLLRIRYDAPVGSVVRAEVRDLLGRKVRAIENISEDVLGYSRSDSASRTSGSATGGVATWDGRGDGGALLPTGTYLITLSAGGVVVSRAVQLLR